MRKILLYLLILTASSGFSDNRDIHYQEFRLYSREEIFNHPVAPKRSPIKYYLEADINGDGTNDLIFSESIYFGGTGGLPYHVYLGKGNDIFQKIPIIVPYSISHRSINNKWVPIVTENETNSTFGASMMALEISKDFYGTRRLWIYWHMSARSGIVNYLYFNRKGELKQSRGIEVFSSPGEDELGDEILNSIFRKRGIKRIKITVPETKISNHQVEPIVKTPVDEVEAQSTQAHPITVRRCLLSETQRTKF